MSASSSNKKQEKLGMPIGTASNRLLKSLLFEMAVKLEQHTCYRCGQIIETCSDMSIDHKIAWLNHDDPIEMFFSLDNIAFSHKLCNNLAAQRHKTNRRQEEIRKLWAESKRRCYDPNKRHQKWIEKGQ